MASTAVKQKRVREGVLQQVWLLLSGGELTPRRAALSLFVGLYIGCQPLFGLHLLLCLVVCLPLRLHFALAYLAANISNPLFAPFLLMLELETGAWLLEGKPLAFNFERAQETGASGLAWQTLVGAQLVGFVCALLGACLGFLSVRLFKRQGAVASRGPALALARVGERYVRVHPKDRIYANLKLRMDPLTRRLCELSEPLGRVLDVGCGRGQFSLLLLELKLANQVVGFDWDERKVATARLAANGDAEYSVADAASTTLPASDTLLLFDVLHYLPREEQEQLLRDAGRSVGDRGRILIRELDRSESWLSVIGQGFERLATRTGYNRARRLAFRPIAELTAQLEELGFDCEEQRSLPLPWSGANVLIVATPNSLPDSAADESLLTTPEPR